MGHVTSVSSGLMLGVLMLCVGAAAMFDSTLDVHWELWKKTHNRMYESEVHRRVFRPKSICMIAVRCL